MWHLVPFVVALAAQARAQTCTGDGTLVALNDVIAAGDFISDQCEGTLCGVWQRAMVEQGRVARTGPPQAELRFDAAAQQWEAVRPVLTANVAGAGRQTAVFAQELTPRGGAAVRAVRGLDGLPVLVHRTRPADAQAVYTDSVWLTQCERADCAAVSTYTLATVARPAAAAAPLTAAVLDAAAVSDGRVALLHEADGTTTGALTLRLYTPHTVQSALDNVLALVDTVASLEDGARRRLGAVVRAHPLSGLPVVVELWLDQQLTDAAASPGQHVYYAVVHRCDQAACTTRTVRETALGATAALHPDVLPSVGLDALVEADGDGVQLLTWARQAAAGAAPRILHVRCATTDSVFSCGTVHGIVQSVLDVATPSTADTVVLGGALRRNAVADDGADVELVLSDGRVTRVRADDAITDTELQRPAGVAAAATFTEAARAPATGAWTLVREGDGAAVVVSLDAGRRLSSDAAAACGGGGLAVLSSVGAPSHGPAAVRACRTQGDPPALALTTCAHAHCALAAV